MVSYKLTFFGTIKRNDGAFIPKDLGNNDYLAYLKWVEEGNTPEPAETREEAITRVAGRVKAERDRRKAGGVKVGEKRFHSDDASRIQQLALVIMGENLPKGLQWKTLDGTFTLMTAALAQQIFLAQAGNDQALFAAAEAHLAAMEASENPAAYDYSGGWPKIFGE